MSRASSSSRRTGRISKSTRKRLPLRVFVFPDRRAWPIENATAARAAIQHLQMGHVKSAAEYLAIMNFVRARFPAVWREYAGSLSWPKARASKARAARSRARTSRRSRRSMAANGRVPETPWGTRNTHKGWFYWRIPMLKDDWTRYTTLLRAFRTLGSGKGRFRLSAKDARDFETLRAYVHHIGIDDALPINVKFADE